MKATKNWSKVLLAGMAAMLLAFGLVLVGCDDGNSDDNTISSSGSLTINNVPSEYNGKYARAQGTVGGRNVMSGNPSGQQFFQVSNGTVTLPLWDVTGLSGNTSSVPPNFTGSGAGSIVIYGADDANGTGMVTLKTLTPTFTDGKATVNW
ncbi:hypothetical protein AGMMS50255_0260 [Spirochaetia bacterium]|nr:hypothetical protein AGMMS50255_0230 [Spirochaetia bacterium]GHV86730.1 hypothetical protein AGMMS50255_0260 [Spirochaetia bacterium]